MADHAVSHYRELPPPRSLSDHLVCVWTQRIEGAGEYRHPVLPDGCVDIVWIGESPPVVAGPATRRVDVEVPTGTTIIGARLRPGWAATSLALPLDELLDQHVPLTDVLGRRAPSWADRALRRRPIPGRLREAIRALTKPLLAAAEADPGIRRSVTWLARHPKGRISRLADHLPVSERHLRRRFRAAVGYGPKTFQRIMRFQRLLTMARDGKRRMSLAALAHRVGYADQAHMCREVRRLADETPGSLLGRRKGTLSMSDLFKTEDRGVLRVVPYAFRQSPNQGGTMDARIKVITLGVDDLEISLAFYRDGLGLPTEGIVGTEFEDGAVVFFEMNDDLILALYPRAALAKDAKLSEPPAVPPSFSIGHIVASRREVDAVMKQAEDAGATITDPAHDRFWGGYSGYFRDLDGHLWEIAWNPAWEVKE